MSDLVSAEDISGSVYLYDIDFSAAKNNEIISNRYNAVEGAKTHWDCKAVETIGEALATKKANWIDFDASPLLSGMSMEKLTDKLTDYIISVANGLETKNEQNDYREISIFKDGIVL